MANAPSPLVSSAHAVLRILLLGSLLSLVLFGIYLGLAVFGI